MLKETKVELRMIETWRICLITFVSSILCFIGLQGPLFGGTRFQCPFAFSVSLLLFSLASDFEWPDRLNEISVIIFTYLLFSIKDN